MLSVKQDWGGEEEENDDDECEFGFIQLVIEWGSVAVSGRNPDLRVVTESESEPSLACRAKEN